jgi:hypothetical protein
MNKTQKMLLRVTALFLVTKNGSTTTLEVKEELRRRFAIMPWRQEEVSKEMMELEEVTDTLTFEDTGMFRIYKLKTDTEVAQDKVSNFNKPSVETKKVKKDKLPKTMSTMGVTKRLSRTKIVDMMRESKGRFYTVTFKKVDGTTRTMNGQTKKSNFMDNLGYINFRESNGNQRRVNPKTITEISISGNLFKVK